MGVLSGTLSILAGLCGVMGIITATEVIDPLATELTWMFWFGLAGVLFLASIAASLGRGE